MLRQRLVPKKPKLNDDDVDDVDDDDDDVVDEDDDDKDENETHWSSFFLITAKISQKYQYTL